MPNVRRNLGVIITPATGPNSLRLKPLVTSGLVVGTAATMQLVPVGGKGPYSYSLISGSLPTGMGAFGASTGTSTGTPSTAGPFSFIVQVQDSTTPTPQSFQMACTVQVAHALSPSAYTPPTYDRTQFFPPPYQLAVNGATGTVSWSIASGAFPTGLSMSTGAGGGLLTASSGVSAGIGTYNTLVQASDSGTGDVIQFYVTTTVVAFPQIAANTQISAVVGQVFQVPLTITGGVAPFTFWTNSSLNLPAGVTISISQSGVMTGVCSAVVASAVSPAVFTVDGKDAVGTPFSQTVGIFAVPPNPTITHQQSGSGVGNAGPGTFNWIGASLTNASNVLTVTISSTTVGAQPLDADLTAIAALSGTGVLWRTGVSTWALNPSQSANLFYASPNGSSGAPSMRAIVAADLPVIPGTFLKYTFVTAGTTFTTQPNTTKAIVHGKGAGGASGSCGAASAAAPAVSGGGGEGGEFTKQVTVVGNHAYTIAIGAAGVAAAAGNNPGGNGGNTTFNDGTTTYTAGGGTGGGGDAGAASPSNRANGGAGGTATNGDVNKTGRAGDPGLILAVSTVGAQVAGRGAGNSYGAGADGKINTSASAIAGNSAALTGYLEIWEFA